MNKPLFAVVTLLAVAACEKSDEDFDYGASAIAVRTLKKKVANSKCDGGAVFELVDVMRRAGNAVGAGKELVAFRTQCNNAGQLRLENEIQREAKQFQGAL